MDVWNKRWIFKWFSLLFCQSYNSQYWIIKANGGDIHTFTSTKNEVCLILRNSKNNGCCKSLDILLLRNMSPCLYVYSLPRCRQYNSFRNIQLFVTVPACFIADFIFCTLIVMYILTPASAFETTWHLVEPAIGTSVASLIRDSCKSHWCLVFCTTCVL